MSRENERPAFCHFCGGSYGNHSEDCIGSMSMLKAQRDELLACLDTYVGLYPAFRSKPVGAPGSLARQGQNFAIQLEDRAYAAIEATRRRQYP